MMHRGWALSARAERTDRPESERLLDLFRIPTGHADFQLVGITRWSIGTVQLAAPGTGLPRLRGTHVTPFVEVARATARAVRTPAVFVPAEFYGSATQWSLSLGARVHGHTFLPLPGTPFRRAAPGALTPELRQKLAALPELLGCPLRLIDGNHERGSWFQGLGREPSTALGPLWLSHGPEPRPDYLNLCGHLHPVAVVGRGADRLRLPCFAYRKRGDSTADHQPGDELVLPAFGNLTGGHPCLEADALWLVAEGTVVPWPAPGSTKHPNLNAVAGSKPW
jgi:hypothetical protein